MHLAPWNMDVHDTQYMTQTHPRSVQRFCIVDYKLAESWTPTYPTLYNLFKPTKKISLVSKHSIVVCTDLVKWLCDLEIAVVACGLFAFIWVGIQCGWEQSWVCKGRVVYISWCYRRDWWVVCWIFCDSISFEALYHFVATLLWWWWDWVNEAVWVVFGCCVKRKGKQNAMFTNVPQPM